MIYDEITLQASNDVLSSRRFGNIKSVGTCDMDFSHILTGWRMSFTVLETVSQFVDAQYEQSPSTNG